MSRKGGDYIELLSLIKQLAPESINIIEQRYRILKTIAYNQPVGRRVLANELEIGERTIRTEVESLKDLKLLNINNMGMYVTDDGERVLKSLNEVYKSIKGIPELTKKLNDSLNIKKIIIVPGDSEKNQLVLRDIGKAASEHLKKIIKSSDILGVTGGNTMAAVSDEISSDTIYSDVIVIPARGGLGKDLKTQANSIAAKIGQNLGASYRLLYIPDSLGTEALELVLKNKEIKESLGLINQMRILLFGIGRADTMAARRNLTKNRLIQLMESGAVAEAFGHYFDIHGKDIWEYKTVGLSLGVYKSIEEVIGVAGGADKAEAIIAIASIRKDITLVIDEAVANKLLELLN